jgi:peptide-methionine (S)-S-oxide reductase
MKSNDKTLPGRADPMPVTAPHQITGNTLKPPFADGLQCGLFAMGCFWGAEKIFWSIPGVYTTAVGYTAGATPNPTYEEVCSGRTGHTEAVLVVFDPQQLAFTHLLKKFWEGHDPTQGMRQGNDTGTQYRSGIYYDTDKQRDVVLRSKVAYEKVLHDADYGSITTEILPASEFYYAEDYHQQYLAKNPAGYCGLGGTAIVFEENSLMGSEQSA